MKCEYCLSTYPEGSSICPSCFAPITKDEVEEKKINPKESVEILRDTGRSRKKSNSSTVSGKVLGNTANKGATDTATNTDVASTKRKTNTIEKPEKTLEEVAGFPINDSSKSIQDVIIDIENSRKSAHRIALGIDPGERHTGVSLRDDRGIVFLSSTYRRPDTLDEIEWSFYCADIARLLFETFSPDVIGIEKVVQSTGFSGGKRAPLNPKYIMMTAMAVGAISREFKNEIQEELAILVRPRKNGSQVGEDAYPSELSGRRPNTLPGYRTPAVKVRDHEKSAYDVAGTALFQTRGKVR